MWTDYEVLIIIKIAEMMCEKKIKAKTQELEEKHNKLNNAKRKVVKCPNCGASSIKNNKCEYCGSEFILGDDK